MPRPRDLSIFLVIILTFLIWSNSFIAVGWLRQSLDPVELIVLRFVPVGLWCLALILLRHRRAFLDLCRRHPVRLLAMGAVQVWGYNFCLNYGQGYVNPAAAALIITLNALATHLLAARFLAEPLTWRRLAGVLIALGGLVVVIAWGRVGLTESLLIPLDKLPYALILILAPVCWAIYTVILKPLTVEFSPAALNDAVLAVGSLPLLFLIDGQLVAKVATFHLSDYVAWVFLSLGCTILAFFLWVWAVKHWRASNVSLFVFLNPPLASIFSFLIFGTRLSGWFLVGGSVMLLGIGLAVTGSGRGRPKVEIATED